jgi:hypothetical protein
MLLLSFQISLTSTHWLKLSVTVLFLCVATNSFAVIQQSLILPLTFEHETNPGFSSTDEQPINRVIFIPNYSLVVNKGTEQLTAAASLRIERSSDQTISEDRNDPSLNLGWQHDYETGNFAVTALMNEQSTRVSEFTDSGLVNADNTRNTRTVSINWLNNLTEITSLTLNGAITNVTFDRQVTTDLVDYRNEFINTRLSYSLGEQTESFAQLSFSRFKPEDVNSIVSETRSYDVGLTWQANEIFNMTASAGANETKSNTLSDSSTKSWQAMLNMQYTTLRTNSHLSVSRNQTPSSTGNINERNQLTAGWTYNLSERDNIALGFSGVQNLTLNNIETKSLSVNYTRQINLSWDFRLSVMDRNRNDNLTSITSNSIMASIIYNLPSF